MTQRFECSVEAASLWGRLLSLYALKRAKGDCQREGVDWAERAEVRGSLGGDLGTDSRLLYCAAERALELLAVQGHRQEIGVVLARRRLDGKSLWKVRQEKGLDYDVAHEYLDGAKEYLAWSLRDDAGLELPDLPF